MPLTSDPSSTGANTPAGQSPAMHTPSDPAASGSATPGVRAVTRAATAAAISQPEAAGAAGRAGATPAGKPPLPPTASKAVSAYRSAQRQRTGPGPVAAPTVKTRASSPGLGAPASSPASSRGSPTSSPAAAVATADESTGRPVTRRSAQQQVLANSSGREPSGTAWDADKAPTPTPTTRGPHGKKAAEVSALGHLARSHPLPGAPRVGKSPSGRQAQASVGGKLGGVSKKRSTEMSLASQGEQRYNGVTLPASRDFDPVK